MTDTITNTELASRLSRTIDRWNTRENQMIALIAQPDGTVIVTDGLGNNHQLSSFPQLQKDVQALMDDLTGAVAQAQDINAVSVTLLNQANAGVATIDASLEAAEAAAEAAEASKSAAATSASQADSHKNAANTHKNNAATEAGKAKTEAITATTKANAAAASAGAAAVSASAAAGSATNAAQAAEDAATEAGKAQTSAGQALTYRNQANTHKNTANAKATEAAQSATEAEASKSAAATSASQADSRKNAAAASATTATAQATIASGASEIAADAADIAVTERTAAQTAATTAGQHAARASEWANKAPNTVVANGQYSARHWAQQAQNIVSGAMTYKGAWSATSGQFPANPVKGHLYMVDAAGTVGGIVFAVGDQLIYNGSQWEKIENVQSVTSVSGKTGAVTLAAGDIKSGTLNAARIPALPISKVTGLQTALDGKAPGAHLHATADIPGLQSALDDKAAASHGHVWGDVSNTPATATRWPKWNEVSQKPEAFPPAAHAHPWGEVTEKPAAFPPGPHAHSIAEVTGLQSALNGKLNLTGGTLTGSLTVNGTLTFRGSATYNAACFLRDVSNSNRGALFFDRVYDHLEMRRFNAQGQTHGRFWIDDTGTCQTSGALHASGALTAGGWAAVKAKAGGHTAVWLKDENNANHGALIWNRDQDIVQMQRRRPDTGGVQGEIRIKSDGHVQIYGEVTAALFKGNATSANKLTSSTKINGTSFNGTADIITARWGADRTLKIGNAAKTVNGTGNVTWTLAEIGAAEASHTHAIGDVTGLQAALDGKASKAGAQYTGLHHFTGSHVAWGQEPAECIRVEMGSGNQATWLITGATGNQFKGGVQMLDSGTTMRLYTITGQYAELNGNVWNKASIPALDYLPLAGGTLTGWLTIDTPHVGNSLIRLRRTGAGQRTALVTTDAHSNTGFIDESPNNNQWLLRIDAAKNAHFPGKVNASGFNGNATSADTLNTARTLKIGNTGKAFNGSADVTWTPTDLGYASGGGPNGWMKRPDGIIEQWGIYLMNTASETTRSVTFPIAFPTACLNVSVTDLNPVGPNNKNYYDMYAQVNHGSVGQTGFSVYIQAPGSSSWNWVGMYWRAIGH